MAFNTRPSTIREVNSWVNKRVAAAQDELRRTDPSDPKYQYLLDRIAYMEKYVDARTNLMGKKLPPKRDRSNEKNLPYSQKFKRKT
jgi:hypothetical protein